MISDLLHFPCDSSFHQSGTYRIIEIEWAVKNDKVFVPSPKRPKKTKGTKKTKGSRVYPMSDENMDVDYEEDEKLHKVKGKGKEQRRDVEFGLELTNTDSPNKSKRSMADREDGEDDGMGTPPKRQKRTGVKKAVTPDSSEDEWVPPPPVKKGKRKLAA